MLASRQLKVSQPTSPKEPGGPKVIIPLALITDLCVLSAEYISRDLCTAALRGLCVHVCACPHTFSHLIIDQRAACLRYKHNHASDGGRKDKTMLCNVGRACRLCNTKS